MLPEFDDPKPGDSPRIGWIKAGYPGLVVNNIRRLFQAQYALWNLTGDERYLSELADTLGEAANVHDDFVRAQGVTIIDAEAEEPDPAAYLPATSSADLYQYEREPAPGGGFTRDNPAPIQGTGRRLKSGRVSYGTEGGELLKSLALKLRKPILKATLIVGALKMLYEGASYIVDQATYAYNNLPTQIPPTQIPTSISTQIPTPMPAMTQVVNETVNKMGEVSGLPNLELVAPVLMGITLLTGAGVLINASRKSEGVETKNGKNARSGNSASLNKAGFVSKARKDKLF